MDGDFEAFLLNPEVLDLLNGDGCCEDGEDVETFLERRIRLYLAGATNDDEADR